MGLPAIAVIADDSHPVPVEEIVDGTADQFGYRKLLMVGERPQLGKLGVIERHHEPHFRSSALVIETLPFLG